MTVYIVTANYVSATEGDADFIIDSVYTNVDTANKRVKEIDQMTEYPEGIYGQPYYGEIVEKKVQEKYLWISFDEWKKENDKIYEENR